MLLVLASAANAEPLTIAVASNFARPAEEIVAQYEEASGEPVRLVTASTGKLYAQIMNGAPFDLLLAPLIVISPKFSPSLASLYRRQSRYKRRGAGSAIANLRNSFLKKYGYNIAPDP